MEDPIPIKQKDSDRNVMTMKYEQFDRATSENLPRTVYASGDSCTTFLDILFGGSDYNYFIKSQASIVKENGTYKIFYVEDADGENHSVFFLIEK